MKALNKVATEIFLKLFSAAASKGGHVKINNNESFMPAVIEILSELTFGPYEAQTVSIAHYGKQNGDLMADPEIVFLYIPLINKVYPMSFTNHYMGIYLESIFLEDDKWKISKKEQFDEAIFASDWMENIAQQQNL